MTTEIEKPPVSFRDVVAHALADTLRQETAPERYAGRLALELRAQLRTAGYAIHAEGECIRPKGPKGSELGRPMTPEEIVLFGLAAAADAFEALETGDG